VSLTPKALQDLLDELEASRASRKRAWENLQEIRWVLKDAAGVELPPPARKTIDLEGRIVKDGVGKTVKGRRLALNELVKAIGEFRKFTDQPLTHLSQLARLASREAAPDGHRGQKVCTTEAVF
jgi:hypothetical protein